MQRTITRLIALFVLPLTVAAQSGKTDTTKTPRSTKTGGSNRTPTFGSVKAPSFGMVKGPTYGSNKTPSSVTVKPAPGGSAKTPTADSAKGPATGTPHGVTTIPSAKPAPAPGPGAMDARFYHMEGPSSEVTWDFSADGTYLKTHIGGGAGVSARSSERGTYTIENGTLETRVTRQTTASTTTVTGGNRSTLTGSTQTAPEVHRYAIKLLGVSGNGGMVLDGVTYKVKNW